MQTEQKYAGYCRTIASHILRNPEDADEALNDTWLAAWNSIPPQNPNPLISYVCKIARNLALDRWRSNRAEKRNGEMDLVLDEMEDCIPSNWNLETEVEARELTEAINRFLASLPKDDRFLFVRRYWYGDSVADLAAMTKSSANRISVRLFRIREKLRKTLTEEGYSA